MSRVCSAAGLILPIRGAVSIPPEPAHSAASEERSLFVVRSLHVSVLIASLLGCGEPDSDVALPDASAAAVPEAVALHPGSRFNASGFPEAPGQALVIAHCTACHSGKLVQQNRATRYGWSELIRWMQNKQGLWTLAPETESKLLDYLTAHYGPDKESGEQRRLPLPQALMPPAEADAPEESKKQENV